MRRTQSVDTAEAVEQRLMAAYGAMAPWEKLHIVGELSKASLSWRPPGFDCDIRLRPTRTFG